MLAQLARELPAGGHLYEPEWDGFRCLATCAKGEVDLRSRNGRPLARYLPGIVEPLRAHEAVFGGELRIASLAGSDSGALLNRPARAAGRCAPASSTARAT